MALPSGEAETLADLLGQRGIGVAGEDFEAVGVHRAYRLWGGHSDCVRVLCQPAATARDTARGRPAKLENRLPSEQIRLRASYLCPAAKKPEYSGAAARHHRRDWRPSCNQLAFESSPAADAVRKTASSKSLHARTTPDVPHDTRLETNYFILLQFGCQIAGSGRGRPAAVETWMPGVTRQRLAGRRVGQRKQLRSRGRFPPPCRPAERTARRCRVARRWHISRSSGIDAARPAPASASSTAAASRRSAAQSRAHRDALVEPHLDRARWRASPPAQPRRARPPGCRRSPLVALERDCGLPRGRESDLRRSASEMVWKMVRSS